jgi:MerR family transcriptional regulator, repressor of the yfmOP operon
MEMQAGTPELQNSMTSMYYTIEQVATRTNLTKRTLRYYEEVGLLRPTERTEGNYRRYTEEDIQRIEYIKKLRDLLGFSLNDIRALLDADEERVHVREAYRQETDVQRKIAQLKKADDLIHEQLALVEQKIAGLEQMRHSLLDRIEQHEQTRRTLSEKIQNDSF